MKKMVKYLLIAGSAISSFSAYAGSEACSFPPDAFGSFESSTCISAASLDASSPSSVSGQIVANKLNSKLKTQKQRRAQLKMPPTLQADLKYEQGKLSSAGSGDIEGITASLSTEIADTEVGLYVPYEYLDFKRFSAHRTGALAYAKRDWQLPSSLQLTTLVHVNTVSTFLSEPGFNANGQLGSVNSTSNTIGAGFGTALSYDDGGVFVPKAMFAFQYSQDYEGAKRKFNDNEQYLVKLGGSLGYRLLENATVNAGFVYNLDVTGYQNPWNKNGDHDYFDLTIGGSYEIAEMWQVTASYKRVLGLDYYHSNAVFLGTTLGF